MSRPTVWPWLKPFIILLLVVSVPPLTYWFVYVKHTVDAAKQQSYSTLAAVATNLKDRMTAHDQIAATAESSAKSNSKDLQSLKEHLQSVLQIREAAVVAEEAAHLSIATDNGGLYVQVGKFAKGNAGARKKGVVRFERPLRWKH